ncbi:MAG TPA: response regulator transcription factor [Actinomycetes bacterium]|jgi:DNA-binding NarL/FixJ family response regulator|nr:response regulator transcription factor [Actinomycetes bacterium]
MPDPIGVLLVDDHLVVRQGLRAFLEVQDDIVVVGEAGDGDAALALISELQPDVVLLDLQMPGMSGVEVLQAMRARGAAARVLVVTSFTQPEAVLPAMRAGAAGYVYKDVEPASLAQGIRSVHAGQTLLADDVAAVLVAGGAASPSGSSGLTEREGDVLRELAQGRSNREIARALVVSEKTVKTHVSNILLKLGVQDRTQAALWAVRNGAAPR